MTYINLTKQIERYKARVDSPTTSEAFAYDSSELFRADTTAQRQFFNPASVNSHSGGEVLVNSLKFNLDMNSDIPDGVYSCKYVLSIKRSTNNPIFFNDGNNINTGFLHTRNLSPRNCIGRHNYFNYNAIDARRLIPNAEALGCFKYNHKVFSHGGRFEQDRDATLEVEFTCAAGTALGAAHDLLPKLSFGLDNGSGTNLTSTSDFTISYYTFEIVKFNEDIAQVYRKFI